MTTMTSVRLSILPLSSWIDKIWTIDCKCKFWHSPMLDVVWPVVIVAVLVSFPFSLHPCCLWNTAPPKAQFYENRAVKILVWQSWQLCEIHVFISNAVSVVSVYDSHVFVAADVVANGCCCLLMQPIFWVKLQLLIGTRKQCFWDRALEQQNK